MLERASSLWRKLDHLTTRVSGTGEPSLVSPDPTTSLTAPSREAEDKAEVAVEVEEESAEAETALVAAAEEAPAEEAKA